MDLDKAFDTLNNLNEDMQLHRGIFWVKDPENIEGSSIYLTVDCDANGNNLYDPSVFLNSKDGKSYNHERSWSSIDSTFREGKSYNYFPRGRVEIANGKAEIYCSPYIYGEELKSWCIRNFNLTPPNGIKKVRLIADNSTHYNCHYDR